MLQSNHLRALLTAAAPSYFAGSVPTVSIAIMRLMRKLTPSKAPPHTKSVDTMICAFVN